MKLPKIFLPDKSLEGKVGRLKSRKKINVKRLNELVLWKESDEFITCEILEEYNSKEEGVYSYLDIESINEKYLIKYDDVILLLLEFVDKSALDDSKKDVKGCLERFNSKNMYLKLNAVFKDQYLVFVETFLGDYDNRSKFIDAYKKKFGFREFKE
ncbi:MAG: hypothetical protein Q8O03_05260 [Nanoarchaeota archaeon]|nr:hypothetical protein [Nanoarchaeota archaeon]